MKSMFPIFYMLMNSIDGYLFQQTTVETVYPDIARRRPDLILHDTNDFVDGSGWISFLEGLDTASLSMMRIEDAKDFTQDFLICYNALGENYTLIKQNDSEHAITYSHLIYMGGQRIAGMQLDDMCICFANSPAEYWYWYLCDDMNIKPQDISRESDSIKAWLLLIMKRTRGQVVCIVQASPFRYKHTVYNKKGFRPLELESSNMLSRWSVSGSGR